MWMSRRQLCSAADIYESSCLLGLLKGQTQHGSELLQIHPALVSTHQALAATRSGKTLSPACDAARPKPLAPSAASDDCTVPLRLVCVAGIAPVPCKGSNWPSRFLDQSRGLIRGDCKSRLHATLTAVAAGPPLKQLPYVCLPVPCVLCEYDSDLCSARGSLRRSVRVHYPSIFIWYVFRKAARLLGGVKPKSRWKFKQGLSRGMGSFDPAQPEARCGAPSVTIGTSLQARTWFGAMEEDRPLGPTESRPRPYEPFKSLHAYGDRIAACKYGLQRHHPAKVWVLCFGLLPSIS